MQPHRHAFPTLRLWVLGWLLLALGAAVASPLLQPRGFALVCSGANKALQLVHLKDGHLRTAAPTLDCPLCIPADAPPPAHATAAKAPPASATAAPTHGASIAFSHTHRRPPARAPPVFS